MKSASRLPLALLITAVLACCRSAPELEAEHEAARLRPFRCANCHAPEARATTHPPHLGVRPEACGVCHSQSSWGASRIEHPFWELTGAHARAAVDRSLAGKEKRVKCFWCHRGEPAQFAGTPRACLGCHAEDREGVRFPEHETFSDDCATCHSTEAWKPAQRPHVATSSSAAASATASSAPPPATSTSAPKPQTAPRRSPKPVTPRPEPTSTPTTTPTPTFRPTLPPPDITTGASRHRH